MSDKTLKVPVTQVKKALKIAHDMGIQTSGYEITPEGGLRVLFATGSNNNGADAALAAWQQGRNDG